MILWVYSSIYYFIQCIVYLLFFGINSVCFLKLMWRWKNRYNQHNQPNQPHKNTAIYSILLAISSVSQILWLCFEYHYFGFGANFVISLINIIAIINVYLFIKFMKFTTINVFYEHIDFIVSATVSVIILPLCKIMLNTPKKPFNMLTSVNYSWKEFNDVLLKYEPQEAIDDMIKRGEHINVETDVVTSFVIIDKNAKHYDEINKTLFAQFNKIKGEKRTLESLYYIVYLTKELRPGLSNIVKRVESRVTGIVGTIEEEGASVSSGSFK